MSKLNVVITYRNEGDDSYFPLINMAIQNIKGWGYNPIIVGNKLFGEVELMDYHNDNPLMVWILEAQLEYLRSPDFDCNSIFFSPDALIIKPIHDKFTGFDLAVTLRKQHDEYALNNGVIFISPKNKEGLIKLWERAVFICKCYREELQEWGGDQKALHDVLKETNWKPEYLEVVRFDCADYNAAMSKYDPILDNNIMAQAHIIHFKGSRKTKMKETWNKIKDKIYG